MLHRAMRISDFLDGARYLNSSFAVDNVVTVLPHQIAAPKLHPDFATMQVFQCWHGRTVL
jgi:hypothetical protein